MFYQFHHLGSPDYLKVEKGIDFSFPPHLHQCFEIIMILDGTMDVTVDGKGYTLSAGQATMIFPNQIHAMRSERCRHLLVIFSPRLVQAYASRLVDRVPEDHAFWPDGYLMDGVSKLQEAGKETRKGILYALCGQFDAGARYRERGADTKNLLYRMFYYVEQRYAEECTLGAMAEELGYDYSYLSRYFKKAVGISFNEYVNHYRLSQSCYLMDNSDRPILQCAMESGFASIRSFNRNFKEQFGITPVQYRKKQG